MPTIRDISEYTGLAFGTVSKYLNGGKVRPENRMVLDEAVAKLHYRVNYAARTLKRQRSNTIGVVLPASSLSGMGTMLTALDRTLAACGYATILCTYVPSAPERDKLRLLSGNVDGIVILPNVIRADEILALCGELPVVLLDSVYPGAAFDSVLTDYLGAAYHAAEYLFSRQHTHIGAILGAQNSYSVCELKTGLLRAFADYQQTPDETLLLESECGYAQGYALFLRLCEVKNPPTAILITDPMLSMGAEAAANEKGMRMMQDIELVGFGEQGTHRIPGRRIPLFELSGETVGVTAAELMLDRLNGGADALPKVRRIKAELRMPNLQTAQ
jgi:DNA-binding LacI/PurR family transcriptional regulator